MCASDHRSLYERGLPSARPKPMRAAGTNRHTSAQPDSPKVEWAPPQKQSRSTESPTGSGRGGAVFAFLAAFKQFKQLRLGWSR